MSTFTKTDMVAIEARAGTFDWVPGINGWRAAGDEDVVAAVQFAYQQEQNERINSLAEKLGFADHLLELRQARKARLLAQPAAPPDEVEESPLIT